MAKDKFKSEITGHLEISVAECEDEFNGETENWQEILIHGDPEGLKSLAKLLIKLADLNQDTVIGLPIGEREHIHLRPKFELSNSSEAAIVGRLDAKGTGEFYDGYKPKKNSLKK